MMRIKSILFSIFILITIILLIGSINNNLGEEILGWEMVSVSNEEIIFPYYKIIEEPDTLSVSNEIIFGIKIFLLSQRLMVGECKYL
jgi:uncharacterized membrane protein